MKLKTVIPTILLATIPSFSSASGIPTIDVAAIAQATLTVERLKEQYEQMKEDYDAITGNSGIGEILQNEDLVKYIPESGDWREISSYEIGELQERYGLNTEDELRQAQYERELRNMAAIERSYKAQTQRLTNIDALMARANTVETPQEREDLANVISIEQASLQVETNRMSAMQQAMATDARLEEQRANERMAKLFE